MAVVVAIGLAGSMDSTSASDARRRIPGFSFVLAQANIDTTASLSPTDSLRPVERSFILQALENSRNEAEISRLAVSQARSSAIREFAQQLLGDYTQINTALETLARRKAVAAPLQPTSFSDRYRQLAEAGTTFDRAFVREIAVENTRALRLCEKAVADAKDADIRELAGSLLPVIRDHVNKTTNLQKSL